MTVIHRALGLAAFAVVALVFSTTAPANGQAAGSLELVAQSAWVDDGGIFDIQVRVAGSDPESSVEVRVLEPWTERDDFLRQDLPTSPEVLLELEPVVLGEIQSTSNEVLAFQIAVAGPNTPLDDEGLAIDVLQTDGGSAVFPVEVSLFEPDGALADTFVTSLIELPRDQRNAPLQVAIALESHALPVARPDGSIEISDEELTSIEALVDAMVQHPSASVALSISPETLAGLDTRSDEQSQRILAKLRENATPSQLLA